MNILVIGSGGREHALGWKLKQSPQCGKVFFAPGNAGTLALGPAAPLKIGNIDTKTADAIDYFCRQEKIELVVIGPEDPLAQGLADRLARPGRFVFGPVQAAARLEADKAWSKHLMRTASIPTAEARIFTDSESALAFVNSHETPLVVKASGLAKGKGAIVCDDRAQAAHAVMNIMIDRVFGDAGNTVVIEERLVGQEVSVLALVDGRNIFVLDTTQDHKQVGEGDHGANTGGMGAYCPTPLMTEALMAQIEREVLVRIVDCLRREGIVVPGPALRWPDAHRRRAQGDRVQLPVRRSGDTSPDGSAQGRLGGKSCWRPARAGLMKWICRGKPGAPVAWCWPAADTRANTRQGSRLRGLDDAARLPGVTVFHAGTARSKDGQIVTAGGRVLNVVALGDDLKDAQRRANEACAKIHFDGAQYRRDIGFRVMK